MAEIKLTKNELRAQQKRLGQLNKYLPTLQLKKAMLQAEVNEARIEIQGLRDAYAQARKRVDEYASLLTEGEMIDLQDAAEIKTVHKRYENIAGVDVPYFDSVEFHEFWYFLFDAAPWVDAAIAGLRRVAEAKAEVEVAEEKKAALEKELREVSIRVNLFEKVLIPRSLANIKKIKVFLGDQELAAVSQAKVAKSKIEANKQAARMRQEEQEEKAYAN
ncbi:MAG: V-type ATP synthase subunit D [Chlamydiales bacterium]|nr:V-type ATP synthase subunit D [Chlamydiia bacterium]MCP5506727.1 V-type ATP synthase subunit D [Chlamydiales bacterium]